MYNTICIIHLFIIHVVGGGGQNGSGSRGGGNPQQATLLTGPQLFVNSASQLQFQTGGGQTFYPQEGSQVIKSLNE